MYDPLILDGESAFTSAQGDTYAWTDGKLGSVDLSLPEGALGDNRVRFEGIRWEIDALTLGLPDGHEGKTIIRSSSYNGVFTIGSLVVDGDATLDMDGNYIIGDIQITGNARVNLPDIGGAEIGSVLMEGGGTNLFETRAEISGAIRTGGTDTIKLNGGGAGSVHLLGKDDLLTAQRTTIGLLNPGKGEDRVLSWSSDINKVVDRGGDDSFTFSGTEIGTLSLSGGNDTLSITSHSHVNKLDVSGKSS